MGRKREEETSYRVTAHKVGEYRYARVQRSYKDPKSGKFKRKDITLGSLGDGNKFAPNDTYLKLTEDERDKLIFPTYWDCSVVQNKLKLCHDGVFSYGAVWLLEQVANVTGIKEDLCVVFEKKEYAELILTLAIYLILSKGGSFHTLIDWQKSVKFPYSDILTYPEIKKCLRFVNDDHRKKLLGYRRGRVTDNCQFCAVEYIGYNRRNHLLFGGDRFLERDSSLDPKIKVVVFELNKKLPVFYKSYSNIIPDSSSFQFILTELKKNNFKNCIVITNRGNENFANYEKFLNKSQCFITHINANEKEVKNSIGRIKEILSKGGRKGELFDLCKIDYEFKVDQNRKEQRSFNLYSYFDDYLYCYEQKCLDLELECQKKSLEYCKSLQSPFDEKNILRQIYGYYFLDFDESSRRLSDFKPNEKKIQQKRDTLGYLCLITQNINMNPNEVLSLYNLLTKQKIYLNMIKEKISIENLYDDVQSVENGNSLVLFVVQILEGYLNHIIMTNTFQRKYDTSYALLEEMKSILYVKKGVDEGFMTAFNYDQQDICRVFEFNIPENVAEGYY